MHIMVISGGYPQSGAPLLGVFAFDQAKALLSFGHKITLISIDLRSILRKRKFGLSHSRRDGLNIINVSCPLGRFPYKILSFVGKKAVLKAYRVAVKEFGTPNIIPAHFTLIGNIAYELKKKYQLPLVITEHSSRVNKEILSKAIVRLGKQTYSKADAVLAVSSKLASNLYHHWNIKSIVVPNIVNTIDFKPYKKKPLNQFNFLSVGNLIHQKGFDMLIDAFKLANFDNSVNLFIVGDGPQKNDLTAKINVLQLTKQIKLLGYQGRTRIAELMNNCHAFVLSSRGETFGVVYIEAMSAGLPVIATKCGGPEDFVNERNGLLVELNNVKALSEALVYMKNHIKEYNRDYISKETKKKFNPEVIAKKLTDIYEKVLTKKNEEE